MISAFLNPIILSLGPSTITGLSQPMKAPVGLIAPPQLRFCIVGKIMLAALNICWMYHSVWTVIEYLPDCSDSSMLSYEAPGASSAIPASFNVFLQDSLLFRDLASSSRVIVSNIFKTNGLKDGT